MHDDKPELPDDQKPTRKPSKSTPLPAGLEIPEWELKPSGKIQKLPEGLDLGRIFPPED